MEPDNNDSNNRRKRKDDSENSLSSSGSFSMQDGHHDLLRISQEAASNYPQGERSEVVLIKQEHLYQPVM